MHLEPRLNREGSPPTLFSVRRRGREREKEEGGARVEKQRALQLSCYVSFAHLFFLSSIRKDAAGPHPDILTRPKILPDILYNIGNTPLVRINRISAGLECELCKYVCVFHVHCFHVLSYVWCVWNVRPFSHSLFLFPLSLLLPPFPKWPSASFSMLAALLRTALVAAWWRMLSVLVA